MANEFFKNFPKIQYKMDDGKIIFIKDWFRKSKIEQDAVNSLVEYTNYEVKEGDRPDVVATKLYGNPDLHWTFFLVNDFENYYDWYMDNEIFAKYLDKKYHGQFLIFSSSLDVINNSNPNNITKFLLGEKITSVSAEGRIVSVEPTFKRIAVDSTGFKANESITGAVSTTHGSKTPISVVNRVDGIFEYKNPTTGIKRNSEASGFTSVSILDHEIEENEKKRKIKVIRPDLINGVVRRFEKVMLS